MPGSLPGTLSRVVEVEWPIDTRNPGEVLACAGFAYWGSRIDALLETGFCERGGETTFVCPDALVDAVDVNALTVEANEAATSDLNTLSLDWWQPWGLNPGMKLWAGQQSEKTVLGNLIKAAGKADPKDWLTAATETTGRLGVDCQGTWNALNIGWSLNVHRNYQMLCRPLVELMAFVGLQGFPLGGDRFSGFTYHTWRPAPYAIARLAFAGGSHLSLARHHVSTDKAGSNTILRAAAIM